MSAGDLLTAVLIRQFQEAVGQGMRVLAVTSPSSLVAGRAVQQGEGRLALATGFGTLDAPADPTVSLGDAKLGTARSPVGHWSDTFVALRRGMVGVVTSPAQLDAMAATNLSRVGGTNEAPKLALPGSRGLPDNNDSPSFVWYLFADHNPRILVPKVDFVSGPPPGPDRVRRLLTPLGLFEHRDGWRALGLFAGVDPTEVEARTGFAIDCSQAGAIPPPRPEELAAMEAVDPLRLRDLEFLSREVAAARFAEAVRLERS